MTLLRNTRGVGPLSKDLCVLFNPNTLVPLMNKLFSLLYGVLFVGFVVFTLSCLLVRRDVETYFRRLKINLQFSYTRAFTLVVLIVSLSISFYRNYYMMRRKIIVAYFVTTFLFVVFMALLLRAETFLLLFVG